MKRLLLIALFPITAFATDTTSGGITDVSGYVSCIKEHALSCVNEKCIPAATAGAKDSDTKTCVDTCKSGVEEKCKELQKTPE